ncbi:hypothetical protein JVX91_03085 [Pseudomonas sp. PDNC002]|uniref:hypothetical protein n=1 Tax=Pseudomonas sp. PDNC002 TaxID=2811422 RepID=UPI001963D79F|nr:hypothetical protein [Pseudomonas sp. PDNC002]QRY80121.1 hypothetical protein JVX91_03085 [Pseudomonas sp. PDNC002]
MIKPVDSSTTITYDAETLPLSEEERKAEELALRLEEEAEAEAEAEAEEEELSHPLDIEDQEGWDDNIERLNDA